MTKNMAVLALDVGGAVSRSGCSDARRERASCGLAV